MNATSRKRGSVEREFTIPTTAIITIGMSAKIEPTGTGWRSCTRPMWITNGSTKNASMSIGSGATSTKSMRNTSIGKHWAAAHEAVLPLGSRREAVEVAENNKNSQESL